MTGITLFAFRVFIISSILFGVFFLGYYWGRKERYIEFNKELDRALKIMKRHLATKESNKES